MSGVVEEGDFFLRMCPIALADDVSSGPEESDKDCVNLGKKKPGRKKGSKVSFSLTRKMLQHLHMQQHCYSKSKACTLSHSRPARL